MKNEINMEDIAVEIESMSSEQVMEEIRKLFEQFRQENQNSKTTEIDL